nr:uncharacterized protein LOC121131299 [Lepeophtheirus salmonis]
MSPMQGQIWGAIVTLIRVGHENAKISELCNIPKQTVSKVKVGFCAFVDNGGDPDEYDIRRGEQKRRSDTVSTSKIAKETDLGRTTVRNIVSDELGLKSYARQKTQILSNANMESA